jgi:hypothetical protein
MSNIIYGTFPTEKTLGHYYSNKSKILVYISFGLGCGGNTKNTISTFTKIDPKNIIILCHKTSSALKTIGKIYTGFDPLAASNYVDAYARSIISNSSIYDKIFVFGFSFGGAIVNRVAEELNKSSLINNVKSKIFMATFGSIYIPNDKGAGSQSNINIINYLATGDIASTLHRIKINNEFGQKSEQMIPSIHTFSPSGISICKFISNYQYSKIIPICFYLDNKYICNNSNKKNIFVELIEIITNLQKWRIHNNYGELFFYLLKYRKNNINNLVVK